MNARQVLDRLAERYRGVPRYRDIGEVLLAGAEAPLRATFATEFSRSGGLSFRFHHTSYDIEIVGTSQGSTTSTRGLDPQPTTLCDAVLAAKGITFTAGYTVPLMLLPEVVTWRPMTATRDPDLKGTEAIGGESCFVVKLGSDWADGEVLVSESFALRCFRIPGLQFTEAVARRVALAGIAVEPRIVNAAFKLVVTYEPVF